MSSIKLNTKNAPLLDDYIFKRTFTRDNPNGILRDFLEAILNIKIRNVQVLNSEIPKDVLKERGSVLDIRAELDNKRIVDIEMQVSDEGNIDKRSSVYMSKNISTQIQVPKFINKNPECKTKLEQWLWLIVGKEEKLKMSKLDNPEVKKAMELVDEIMSDSVEREIYDARLMARFNYNSAMAYMKEKGLKEGRERGEKQRNRKAEKESGRLEEKKENAKKMVELNIPEEQICQILNITPKELKELIGK